MSDQLQMFNPETSPASPNAISSPASGGGHLRCASPGGQRTGPSGPALAHASRLAALERDFEKMTIGTSGQISETLSASAALQSSLENGLRARTDVDGSPEYALTWKSWPMLSGPPICALRASRRRTSGKGCIGWRSPSAGDSIRGVHPNPDKQAGQHSLNNEAALSGWPTPNAMAGGQTSRGGDRIDEPLMGGIAKLCGWPTPRSEDSEQTGAHRGQPDTLNSASKVAGWCSPTAQDHSRGVAPPRPQDTGIPLSQQVSGTIPSGTHASTAKPAASRLSLNPFFSAWLMGFPREWTLCGLRALASLSRRKSKGGRASSKATATPSSPS